ncbi:hypothetical protein lerEdw1_003351 [Lerista edwardsae]|nr:hypothetical protein lerEdw1_003351 [Lerista edwardsae]
MCRGCVKTEYLSRGNTCLENGSYLLNFVGCIECKKRDFVMITNRTEEEEDGEEIITYDRKEVKFLYSFHRFSDGSLIEEVYVGVPSSKLIVCLNILAFISDVCKNCHHVIARHEYTFSVVDDYQGVTFSGIAGELDNKEYTMLCMLCGRAEDSISVLPDDPHLMTPLF